MRIFLTGATGFIGRHCVSGLATWCQEAGGELHAVSSRAPLPMSLEPSMIWHRADLLRGDGSALIQEVRPTHWLHLAWSVTPGSWAQAPENFEWVSTTLSLLRAFATSGGTRVVMAGSGAEYDWRYGYCSDVTPRQPATGYGVCKLAMSQLLESFENSTGLNRDFSSAWGRAFFLYGPHENPKRLVASVTRSLLRGEVAPCSSGEHLRDWLHVQDAADAFVVLLRGNARGNFNIGSGQAVAVRDVVSRIAEQIRRPDLLRLGALPAGDDAPLVVADSRPLRELGWTPHFSLDTGLTQTIDWWRAQENGASC